MIRLLFLICVFIISQVQGELASFENLSQWKEGEKIEIRGFLYQGKNEEWILSGEPNLKSCCVGSVEKISHQLILHDTFSQEQINKVVHLQGILHKQDHLYFLDEIKLIENTSHSHGLINLAFASLILLFFLIYRISLKNKKQCTQHL